ncbi:hypothetical protein [Halanaerobium sp. ST460_2HS_T2]|uniref:hypothetical protein n=1 Tax=Halanaerobium sp. ST460_2HS_T2 TaxID=2183914 RepID=UPI000DF2C8F0|nr:hypothetical protein [Halanaerobium sp. ST460_2HS_T2]
MPSVIKLAILSSKKYYGKLYASSWRNQARAQIPVTLYEITAKIIFQERGLKMNNDVDIIKFTTSIIMGTTSVVLGIFAIWLSNKFNNNSSSALEKIKELSNEIKILH